MCSHTFISSKNASLVICCPSLRRVEGASVWGTWAKRTDPWCRYIHSSVVLYLVAVDCRKGSTALVAWNHWWFGPRSNWSLVERYAVVRRSPFHSAHTPGEQIQTVRETGYGCLPPCDRWTDATFGPTIEEYWYSSHWWTLAYVWRTAA